MKILKGSHIVNTVQSLQGNMENVNVEDNNLSNTYTCI